MATVAELEHADLYETDFPVWAKWQAELLRGGQYDDLDLDHLALEVADLGISGRHAVLNAARRILEHFLKVEHSPAAHLRRAWEDTITSHRSDLEEYGTPRLRRDLCRELDGVYARARRDAIKDLRRDRIAADALPTSCPYTLDQILDPDWLPSHRYGIESGT
jgi:hypothetical protein